MKIYEKPYQKYVDETIVTIQLLLILLKVTAVLNCSWWWIMLPLWGSFVLAMIARIGIYFLAKR